MKSKATGMVLDDLIDRSVDSALDSIVKGMERMNQTYKELRNKYKAIADLYGEIEEGKIDLLKEYRSMYMQYLNLSLHAGKNVIVEGEFYKHFARAVPEAGSLARKYIENRSEEIGHALGWRVLDSIQRSPLSDEILFEDKDIEEASDHFRDYHFAKNRRFRAQREMEKMDGPRELEAMYMIFNTGNSESLVSILLSCDRAELVSSVESGYGLEEKIGPIWESFVRSGPVSGNGFSSEELECMEGDVVCMAAALFRKYCQFQKRLEAVVDVSKEEERPEYFL